MMWLVLVLLVVAWLAFSGGFFCGAYYRGRQVEKELAVAVDFGRSLSRAMEELPPAGTPAGRPPHGWWQ